MERSCPPLDRITGLLTQMTSAVVSVMVYDFGEGGQGLFHFFAFS
jgi:hypothetical protein